MRQQTRSRRLISVISIMMIPVYAGVTCTNSNAKAPKFAHITQPSDLKGITIRSRNGQELPLSTKLDYGKVLWVPALEDTFATLRFTDWSNHDMNLKVKAISHNNALTKYKVPCTVKVENYAKAIITWESGSGRACDTGMSVTSKSSSASQKVAPHINFLAYGSKDVSEADPKAMNWNTKALLKAEVEDDNIRYYCSALPSSGRGAAGMAAGLESIKLACGQAAVSCIKNNSDINDNSNSDCWIETMGEWNINDPALMTSVTCKNGKSSYKILSGADISNPNNAARADFNAALANFLEQVFDKWGRTLAELLKLKSGACVLEIYHPDEVLISPVTSQQTVVQVADVGNGNVEVNVQEGQALLRSTQSPEGIEASQGQTYILTGDGVINPAPPPTPVPPYRRPEPR